MLSLFFLNELLLPCLNLFLLSLLRHLLLYLFVDNLNPSLRRVALMSLIRPKLLGLADDVVNTLKDGVLSWVACCMEEIVDQGAVKRDFLHNEVLQL